MKKVVLVMLLGIMGCVSKTKYQRDMVNMQQKIDVNKVFHKDELATVEATTRARAYKEGRLHGHKDAMDEWLKPMAEGGPVEAIKIWMQLRQEVFEIGLSKKDKKMWEEQL